MQGKGSEPLSVFASHLLKYIDEPLPLTVLMMHRVLPSSCVHVYVLVPGHFCICVYVLMSSWMCVLMLLSGSLAALGLYYDNAIWYSRDCKLCVLCIS